ncbi:hypothetical protein [Pseudoteredinibacter isoporae]|uniref:hypothetical protein n=1 Tax=Pseudoteredinibacter isoporae TaxID=570281 RepID=UPI00310447AE
MKKLTTNMVVHIIVLILNLCLFGVMGFLMITNPESENTRALFWVLVLIPIVSLSLAERLFPLKTKTLFDIDAKYSLNEDKDEKIRLQRRKEALTQHNQALELVRETKKGVDELKEENRELRQKLTELELYSMFPEMLNEISLDLRSQADRHHEKASFLLEQGNKFAKNGIYFYFFLSLHGRLT